MIPSFKPSNFLRRNFDINSIYSIIKKPPVVRIHGIKGDGVYSSVYSNIPVYEFLLNDVVVMRRQKDSWLNATHILKAAGVEKGKRTKILDREVMSGRHERVQGGYGRYQGTWITYDRAVAVAKECGIEESLAPLLNLTDLKD